MARVRNSKHTFSTAREVLQAQDAFLAIDKPVRCYFMDGTNDVIDGLPFCWGLDYSVEMILIRHPRRPDAQGMRCEIPFLDFQYMDYEPIEVTDFNWQAYLPEKKRLREEGE